MFSAIWDWGGRAAIGYFIYERARTPRQFTSAAEKQAERAVVDCLLSSAGGLGKNKKQTGHAKSNAQTHAAGIQSGEKNAETNENGGDGLRSKSR